MLKHLEKLCSLAGVSGNEKPVRDYIVSQINGYADVKIDNLGNIIAYKDSPALSKKYVMLSAHMDEVGLIITGATEDGYLLFSTVGGIDPRVIIGKSFLIGENSVCGVVGAAPIHLLSSDKKGTVPEVQTLCLDIGAKDRVEALSAVKLGDCAVFDTKFELFGDGLIKARALDDRAGCAILIDMIQSELPFDAVFCFTVQEEIGLRGSRCAAYSARPDFSIVIEATTAADISSVPREKQVCRLRNGAVASFMDKSTIYDRDMYLKAFELADKNNIKIQTKEAVAGGNDAGAIHVTRSGIRTLALSVPCRYLHSPSSIIATEDLHAVSDLAKLLAAETDAL